MFRVHQDETKREELILDLDEIARAGARKMLAQALEVLKAWCEVRSGRTPHPSDVVEERMRLCVLSGAMISMGRLLEKLDPQR